MKILLTAPPGVGKTTVLETVTKGFEGNYYGIVAREILNEQKERIGFTSVNAGGQSRQFMFLTNNPTPESIGGRFEVDIAAIDEFVVPELKKGLSDIDSLVFIDEIGRAQARSELFLQTLQELFSSDCTIFGSIVYDQEPWSLEFKRDPFTCLLEVDIDNRDAIPKVLRAALTNRHLYRKLPASQKQLIMQLLRQLVEKKQFVAAQKLFDNTLVYACDKRIRVMEEQAATILYEVSGKTSKHKILHDLERSTFHCDCDLSNGRGSFMGRQEICSHELTVRLQNAQPLSDTHFVKE